MRYELLIGVEMSAMCDFIGEDNFCFRQFCEQKKEIQVFRSVLLCKTISFFNENGFMFIDPPILHEHVKNRSENIQVLMQDKKYDLNASNALYMSVYAAIFGNVFSISPTMRLEKQSDNHLIEFRMLECEISNNGFQQCIEFIKRYILFIIKIMADSFLGSVFEKRLSLLHEEIKFDSMTYKELILKLKSKNVSIEYGNDLSECDLEISKLLQNPTFVIDYPHPPATWTALAKNDTTYTFNFLLPDGFGELAEGGERNNDWEYFMNKFNQLDLSSLTWYADAIKNNPCRRSGFGIGIERLIAWLIGSNAIHETVMFYRR